MNRQELEKEKKELERCLHLIEMDDHWTSGEYANKLKYERRLKEVENELKEVLKNE